MDDLKEGVLPVLVATDGASRGLDIEAVSHVINRDRPRGAAAEAAATTDARRRAPCSMPHRPAAGAAAGAGGAAGAAAGRGPKAATRDARRDHRRLGWDGAGAAGLEAPRRARDDRRLP